VEAWRVYAIWACWKPLWPSPINVADIKQFINDAKQYKKDECQNQLSQVHIAKMIDVYLHRKEVPSNTRRVAKDEKRN
jgi:type I restriction-modification system DNA methylase subunit